MTQLSAQHGRIVVWIGLFGLVAQFTLLLLKAALTMSSGIAELRAYRRLRQRRYRKRNR